MSLGLIKPGMRSANLTGKRHPKTGELLVPLGYLKNGTAVWPQMGAGPDDPDDPAFTGEDQDDDDEEDDDEEDEESSTRRKKRQSSRKSKKDEDEDDEDDDDDEEDRRSLKASRQAARYRTRLREKEKENEDLLDRIKALEDRDRDPDEVQTRELTEAKTKIERLTETNRIMQAQLAFFKTPVSGVAWIDPNDVFALAEREGLFDDVIDEDGNVDTRELRRGLRDLARRKKHLVKSEDDDKKARGRKSTEEDDEDEDDDEDQRPRRSARPMNGARKGKRSAGPSRESLAKDFPVLKRF